MCSICTYFPNKAPAFIFTLAGTRRVAAAEEIIKEIFLSPLSSPHSFLPLFLPLCLFLLSPFPLSLFPSVSLLPPISDSLSLLSYFPLPVPYLHFPSLYFLHSISPNLYFPSLYFPLSVPLSISPSLFSFSFHYFLSLSLFSSLSNFPLFIPSVFFLSLSLSLFSFSIFPLYFSFSLLSSFSLSSHQLAPPAPRVLFDHTPRHTATPSNNAHVNWELH